MQKRAPRSTWEYGKIPGRSEIPAKAASHICPSVKGISRHCDDNQKPEMNQRSYESHVIMELNILDCGPWGYSLEKQLGASNAA
ncbi:hypothetical protein STEG23_009258 [Scotinomys teguina]